MRTAAEAAGQGSGKGTTESAMQLERHWQAVSAQPSVAKDAEPSTCNRNGK